MTNENIELKVTLGQHGAVGGEDSTLEFKIKSYRWLIIAIQKAITKELERLKE